MYSELAYARVQGHWVACKVHKEEEKLHVVVAEADRFAHLTAVVDYLVATDLGVLIINQLSELQAKITENEHIQYQRCQSAPNCLMLSLSIYVKLHARAKLVAVA